MNRKTSLIILVAFAFQLHCSCVYGQVKRFSLYINDNTGTQHQTCTYVITQDSLIIKGLSDYGRTPVNYLNRKLEKKEIDTLRFFLKSLTLDSLSDQYYNEYNNFKYITADHFPRVIEVEFVIDKKEKKTKITNAYVERIARLFEIMNKLIPSEVRINYNRNDFNAFY